MKRDEKRGMDAVASKVDGKANGKKRPVLAKKRGPGMAVMIAIGSPKRGGPPTDEEPPMRHGNRGEPRSSVDPIIAKLEARIAKLEAELEQVRQGEEMDEEMDEEYEDKED